MIDATRSSVDPNRMLWSESVPPSSSKRPSKHRRCLLGMVPSTLWIRVFTLSIVLERSTSSTKDWPVRVFTKICTGRRSAASSRSFFVALGGPTLDAEAAAGVRLPEEALAVICTIFSFRWMILGTWVFSSSFFPCGGPPPPADRESGTRAWSMAGGPPPPADRESGTPTWSRESETALLLESGLACLERAPSNSSRRAWELNGVMWRSRLKLISMLRSFRINFGQLLSM
mmetsp:Transcript_19208/g.60428  ORF Transcript_19208/g.60428 Transcript_19208/m.60428 type:complete len:230 (+) Transcript_19208:327-1016(+)